MVILVRLITAPQKVVHELVSKQRKVTEKKTTYRLLSELHLISAIGGYNFM